MLQMKYFVLKPGCSPDKPPEARIHALASREAMRAYANTLDRQNIDAEMANQLREWADAAVYSE